MAAAIAPLIFLLFHFFHVGWYARGWVGGERDKFDVYAALVL